MSYGLLLQATGGSGELLRLSLDEGDLGLKPSDAVLLRAHLDDILAGRLGEGSHRLKVVMDAVRRPAFPAWDNQLPVLPPLWRSWATGEVPRALERVARVQTAEGIGSAFAVGKDLLLTNRHVARLLGGGTHPEGWQVRRAHSICFDGRSPEQATHDLQVERIELVHPRWDLALLRVPGVDVEPLELRATPPRVRPKVAAIGHPLLQPGQASPVDPSLVFGAKADGRKFLMLGQLSGRGWLISDGAPVRAAQHDCSTLGGASGSPLLDDEGVVLAVHSHGLAAPTPGNYAVPSWELARDPRWARLLRFVGRPRAPRDERYATPLRTQVQAPHTAHWKSTGQGDSVTLVLPGLFGCDLQADSTAIWPLAGVPVGSLLALGGARPGPGLAPRLTPLLRRLKSLGLVEVLLHDWRCDPGLLTDAVAARVRHHRAAGATVRLVAEGPAGLALAALQDADLPDRVALIACPVGGSAAQTEATWGRVPWVQVGGAALDDPDALAQAVALWPVWRAVGAAAELRPTLLERTLVVGGTGSQTGESWGDGLFEWPAVGLQEAGGLYVRPALRHFQLVQAPEVRRRVLLWLDGQSVPRSRWPSRPQVQPEAQPALRDPASMERLERLEQGATQTDLSWWIDPLAHRS